MQCEEDVGCGTELEAVFVITGCILCFACLVGCASCAYFVRHKWLRVNVESGNVENPVSLEDFVVPGTVEVPEEVHVPWYVDPTDLAGPTRVGVWIQEIIESNISCQKDFQTLILPIAQRGNDNSADCVTRL